MTTLIIVDDPQATKPPAQLGDGEPIVLLSFIPDGVRAEQLSAELTANGHLVEQVNAAGKLDAAAEHVRPQYAALIAAAPDAIPVGSTTLRRAFVADGRLSLWWINLLFAKRSDAFPTFNRLCQLHLIRQLVAERGVSSCHLLTRDSAFVTVVGSACDLDGIPLLATPTPKPFLPRHAWFRIVVDSIIWFAKTLVQSVLVRRWASAQPDLNRTKPLVAFHTIYPLLWRGSDGDRAEEKFGRTPQELAAGDRLQPAYLCTFMADGHHQRVSVRQFHQLCREWASGMLGDSGGVPIILLDAFSRPLDVLGQAAAQLGTVWRYARLERQPAFRRYWRLDGSDIFPLIQTEWRLAARRTGNYLTYAARMRRFAQQVAPSAVVYTLFEYGLGRSIVYGVRSAETATPTRLIAAQEGPITQYKLLTVHAPGELGHGSTDATPLIDSMPLPDAILLEGDVSRDCLSQAGYPADSLLVRGAPRLSRLAHAPRARRNLPTPPITLLVAFWGYGAESMLVRTRPLLRPGYRVLFKVHPRGDMDAATVRRWLEKNAPGTLYDVVEGDIYALFAKTDIVIVTSSSVAIEAAALGYPTICLQMPNLVTATPLLDIALPTVRFVADDTALLAAVDAFSTGARSSDDGSGDGSGDVARALFDRLDGHSAKRWAATIEQLVQDR